MAASAPAGHPILAHRGVVLVEPALLPALVPDGWAPAGEAGGVRLLRAGGHAPGTRPFHVAPAPDPAAAVAPLAEHGAGALLYVGACTSPTRVLEPGHLLVVDLARDPAGEAAPHPALAHKLWNRAERQGLGPRRGTVASGGARAGSGEAAEDLLAAALLRAAGDAGVPAAAVLVCQGQSPGAGEAPAAVLEAFDRVFGVLQEILGSDRRPVPPG